MVFLWKVLPVKCNVTQEGIYITSFLYKVLESYPWRLLWTECRFCTALYLGMMDDNIEILNPLLIMDLIILNDIISAWSVTEYTAFFACFDFVILPKARWQWLMTSVVFCRSSTRTATVISTRRSCSRRWRTLESFCPWMTSGRWWKRRVANPPEESTTKARIFTFHSAVDSK